MYSARNSAIFRFALTVAAIACAASALAVVRTNTLVNGASNWNDANSYTDTSFVPSTNDVVVIPENATVYLNSSDTASFNIMSNLSYLCFTHTNSVLEITVPEGGDALFDCKFRGLWDYPKGNGQFYSGLIVKKGKGRITAGDGSKYPADSRVQDRHQMPVRVEEGTWRLPQNIPGTGNAYEEMSAIHVEEGATICLSTGNPAFYNQFTRLTGKGTVTTGDSVKRQLRIINQQYGGPSHFGGVFDEGVYYFSSGRVFLEGTNSVMAYTPTVFGGYYSYATNRGYTAVMKFGMTGQPSSVGTNGILSVDVRGGGWGYLGTGETTDKEFRWNPNSDGTSMLFDGGAHGGLTFTGHWRPKPFLYGIGSIVLTGSNTLSACVVDCSVQYDKNKSNSSYTNPVSIVKTGTGIWRFKHNKFRDLLGVFDIQQGTIQADSIEETGVQSALGFATTLYVEGYSNNNDDVPPANKRVTDYAIVLGSEASDSIAGVASEGTLEYTGDNSAYCFTRPYVLDGDARLKNSTSHRFWTGQVRSRSAGAKTLTLDGNSANTNLLADITDVGGGAISLAKEGSGTWIVSGTNDIRGDIAVKAGTLILQNINGLPYTWHKWQIRSNYATSTVSDGYTGRIRPCEFGLFNSNGARINRDLAYCEEYQDLEPGQAAYATHLKRYGSVYVPEGITALARLFDGKSSNAGLRIAYRTVPNDQKTELVPQVDKPETWLNFMMRLAEGAGEAASWDYSDYYGTTGVEGTTRQWNIKTSALYGSANGANWELLSLAANVPIRENKQLWAFDGRQVTTTGAHTNCNTIASRVAQNAYPFLPNMSGAVSVASGAVLECQGAQITFSKLKLDAAGAGTIKNAAFAANGEIAVENVQTKADMVFSSLFDGCADVDNLAGWTIRENGKVSTHLRAEVHGGELRLIRNGFLLICR